MAELDELLCQSARLQIMASLMTLGAEEQVDFTYLRDLLKLTDGNLGAHLLKLEQAEYIVVEKTFVGRKPKTYLTISDKGRRAFKQHVTSLEKILHFKDKK
jgi:DNA-binding MarR family transcriptional regulator